MKETSNQKTQFFINAQIESIENENAILITEDGQKLIWPVQKISSHILQTKKVRILISTASTEEEHQSQVAKNILNEILRNQNTTIR